MDVFYFSAALPEEFTGEDVIWLDAFNGSTGNHMEYDEIRAGTFGENALPYPHVYCSDQVLTDSITFTLTVEKAGLYNVAAHYRIKDQKVRGAKFIANEGTANEYAINHTYGWNTADEAYEVRNNNFLIGSYMTGIVLPLQAGENTITIRVADGVAKSQHFRDLYLVWSADLPVAPEEPSEPAGPATLTAEEAWAKGITYEKSKYSEEFYYVTLTLNTLANANGFARATLDGVDMIISIAAPAGYVEGTYALGDTVTFLAQVGCVNSATTASTKEARLFNATIVEVVKAPVQENTEA